MKYNTKTWAILLFFFCFSFFNKGLRAQDFGFSQYYYTPFLTNPAMIASDNYLNLRLHFRQQPLPDGQNIQTPMFSASMPLISKTTGKRWGGAGISVLNDRATEFMNTFAVMGALAYNLNFGKSNLSLGLQGGYFNRDVNLGNLNTISQYQNGMLNTGISNGENIQDAQVGVFNLSAGAFWYIEKDNEHQAFLGMNASNLNQPELDLAEGYNPEIPLHFNIIGGLNVLPESSKLILMPTIKYNNFAGNNFVNIGTWVRYKLEETTGFIKKGSIGTGLWYNTNQAVIASIELKQPSYMIALSYDFSASDNSQVWQQNGATEITLGFRKLIQGKCKDSDGDGICDTKDDCPDEFGLTEFNGCPDKDGDKIIDKNDDCPEEAGLAEFNGCPDRDGDKIIDKNDDCPEEAGLAEFNGCPDRDGDKIIDKEDKCPDTPGTKELNGCPPKKEEPKKEEITKEEEAILEKASHVRFKTNESIILPESYKDLDEVVALLKKHPEGKLTLDGHTDSQGDDSANLKLSKNRANAIRDYFISKGIIGDRITATGHGETQPIANNSTKEGRAKNRRVEMKFTSK